VTGGHLRDQTHRKLVNRPFRFQKCCQGFIGAHNEALSIAMSVNNPDCAAFAIKR
jgi:hypothetical protein